MSRERSSRADVDVASFLANLHRLTPGAPAPELAPLFDRPALDICVRTSPTARVVLTPTGLAAAG